MNVQLTISTMLLVLLFYFLLPHIFQVDCADYKILQLNCSVSDSTLAEFELCRLENSTMGFIFKVKRPLMKIYVSLLLKS